MIGRRKILGGLRRAAKNAGNDSGSALIEMALSCSLLFATVFGIFQLTMACYTYNSVVEVARESARWAAVRGGTCSTNTPNLDHCGALPSDIQNHARTISTLNWTQCLSNPCVTASWMTGTTVTTTLSNGNTQATTTWTTCTSCTKKPGDMVVVTMSYPYTFNVPFLKQYHMSMSSTSEMTVSQ